MHGDRLIYPEIQQWTNSRNIVTENEIWLECESHRDQLWIFADDRSPQTEDKTLANQKFIFNILWNPRGFHYVMIMPLDSHLIQNGLWIRIVLFC
jgi:hypothetical protein